MLHLRLKKVCRDLRHVISHDQRIIALQRLEEAKKAKEEEKAAAAEEEAARAAAKEAEAAAASSNKEGEEEKPKEEKPPAERKEEEKKAAEEEEKDDDSDASPEEDDGMVEMDDLPEDRVERLRLIGVDQSLIEEGGEMLDIIEMSAMEEYEKQLKIK